MMRPFALSGFLLLAGTFLNSNPAAAQIPQLVELADRLAREIKPAKPRLVAVVDLRPISGANSSQAHYFSLLLSSILQVQDKKKLKLNVADHLAFDTDLAHVHLSADALIPGDSLNASAGHIGADLLIVGTLEKRGNSYVLQLNPVRTASSETLAPLSSTFESNEFFESLFLPLPSDVPSLSRQTQPGSQKGASMPSCIRCPDPSYTDLARRARINGTDVFQVLISAEGEAKQIRPMKLIGYGLDEQAFSTIKKWRFKPATNKDGTPVPVVVPVEVTFRLY